MIDVEVKTADYALTEGDITKVPVNVFTNEGSVAAVNFILPPLSILLIGAQVGFYIGSAQLFTITADSANTLRNGIDVSIFGGSFSETTVGFYVEFVAISATEWACLGAITGGWDIV